MKLTCPCGTELPVPAIGTAVVCGCGISYSASVDLATMHAQQRALAAEVVRLRASLIARRLDTKESGE